jgi:predicted HicB family RNase H-like nuclease
LNFHIKFLLQVVEGTGIISYISQQRQEVSIMPKTNYASLPRSVRVDEDIHQHLKVMAARQHRTVSNLIGVIILQAVERDRSNLRFIEENKE